MMIEVCDKCGRPETVTTRPANLAVRSTLFQRDATVVTVRVEFVEQDQAMTLCDDCRATLLRSAADAARARPAVRSEPPTGEGEAV